jgi:hypothetical protein
MILDLWLTWWQPLSAKTQPMAGHSGACLSPQAMWEAEVGESWFQGNPGQKSLQDPISVEERRVCWCVPIVPAMTESIFLKSSSILHLCLTHPQRETCF